MEAAEAVISKDELSPEDRSRLAIGSFFWWVVGYEATVDGARKHVSQIVFPDLPSMTEADLDRGRDWADWLYKRWGLDVNKCTLASCRAPQSRWSFSRDAGAAVRPGHSPTGIGRTRVISSRSTVPTDICG